MRKVLVVLLILLLLLIGLLSAGWWRSTGVGAQVQVPMFYDAHYLFPRPWTQEQEAPGVPDPAPVSALFGPNLVTQGFVAGADNLAMVDVWIAGPAGSRVKALLTIPNGTIYGNDVVVEDVDGKYYQLTLPKVDDSKGKWFSLTLAAPEATSEGPVTVRAMGGDRLGTSIRLNEYFRPGNMDLNTYSRNPLPGRWWLDSVEEQLLPAAFRLRLQQYKPPVFKGQLFAGLLLLMLVLTAIFLVLARPSGQSVILASAWALALFVSIFLIWEIGTTRLRLPLFTQPIELAPIEKNQAMDVLDHGPKLVHDFPLTLWTAQRAPEERFIETELVHGREEDGLVSAIQTPAQSALRYALIVPLEGVLSLGAQVIGEGAVNFRVFIGEQEILAQTVQKSDGIMWLEAPLKAWAGQETFLTLATEDVSGNPKARWLQPQLAAIPTWLLTSLPEGATAVGYHFGDNVELLGYSLKPAEPQPGEEVFVTLYWQAESPVDQWATAFVHLIDEQGDILTQHDGQPVLNSYPMPVWPSGVIIADPHPIVWPDAGIGEVVLTAGLYDPVSFARWPVTSDDGMLQQEERAVLKANVEAEGSGIE